MRYAILGVIVAAGYYGVFTHREPSPARAPAHRRAQQGNDWTWHGRVAPGKTIAISGINGSISAEPAPGHEVEVRAVKHEGRRGDADDVRIERIEDQSGVTICAVYPGQSSPCVEGARRESRRNNNDTAVEFTVRVPRGVRFSGHTVNGGVEAVGLTGPVEASTVNDGIHIETSAGDVEANTVNGSITAVATGAGTRPLRFHTVNGSITVTLPGNLSADVEASTVNGSISSDFPITVDGRVTPRTLRGRIGQGGRTLQLETVNGSIRIRSGP